MTQLPINTDFVLRARFYDALGAPYTPAVAPTVQVIRHNDDGTRTQLAAAGTATTAESGDTTVRQYIGLAAANTVLGELEGIFTTTDPALAAFRELYERRDYIQIEAAVSVPSAASIATAVWNALTSGLTTAGSIGKWLLDHIGAIETDIDLLGASNVTLVSPVRDVGGEQEIELVQGVTYSIANGNSIDIAFTGLPDTTGASVATLTITDAWGATITSTGNPFTGALGAWVAGAVTARFELTAAQTAAITASWSAALQKDYRFQVKITLAATAGVAIPIPPKTGKLVIKTQAHA